MQAQLPRLLWRDGASHLLRKRETSVPWLGHGGHSQISAEPPPCPWGPGWSLRSRRQPGLNISVPPGYTCAPGRRNICPGLRRCMVLIAAFFGTSLSLYSPDCVFTWITSPRTHQFSPIMLGPFLPTPPLTTFLGCLQTLCRCQQPVGAGAGPGAQRWQTSWTRTWWGRRPPPRAKAGRAAQKPGAQRSGGLERDTEAEGGAAESRKPKSPASPFPTPGTSFSPLRPPGTEKI